MKKYQKVTIRQTRGPRLKFEGTMIAKAEGPVDMEIWETRGGALVAVKKLPMRQDETDTRAVVVEPAIFDASTDEITLGMLRKHDDQRMHFAVLDFLDWHHRAQAMVTKQLGWILVREIA